jgi:hypothetical protein
MMDAFTRAGLRRIAVTCGATEEDVGAGDPAGALVRRWLEEPADKPFLLMELMGEFLTLEDAIALERDTGGWFGLEDTSPLPFIRFAGFVEAGIRFGYLDLSDFRALAEFRKALERWNLGNDVRGRFTGLAVALLGRLAADVQRLSEPRDAAGIAAFESYMRLDETVRRTSDIQEFLTVCHGKTPHAKTDAIFLASPEFFAEAIATQQVRRIPVGGQVSGGLETAGTLERLSTLLRGLKQREYLHETIILHARWAHQVDEVFERLQQWVIRALEWKSDARTDHDPGSKWPAYLAETVIPLADQQRSLNLLASADWHPLEPINRTSTLEPTAASPSEVEDEIRGLTKQADEAAFEGRARAALGLYARAARLRADRLDHDNDSEVRDYWLLIKKVFRLEARDTAAALCAVAYPALKNAVLSSEREELEAIMRPSQRPTGELASNAADTLVLGPQKELDVPAHRRTKEAGA